MTVARPAQLRTVSHRYGAPRAAVRWVGLADAHVAWGVALVVIVGADGSPGWRAARVGMVAVLAVGAVLASRTDRWGRALPSIAHGVVGLTVGIAIGVRHLTKQPVSLDALAGVVALVAGAVLLVGGLGALVAGLPRWRRRAAAAAGLVASAFVVFSAFPSVMVTNVPRLPLEMATPAGFRDVAFTTDDGVRLAGWYAPSRNGAAVVLRHGAGSTRATVVEHAGVLAAAGYGVLATDARGHGDSGGRAMDFGWYGDRDVTAAVDFLVGQPDVDARRVGVVGLSMGGEEAIGAAAADGRIRAVVAEGATARQADDEAWLSDVYGARWSIQRAVERAQDALTGLLTSASKPIALRDAVRASDARFLVVAAGRVDEEQHAAEFLRAGAPDRVETWTVPGAAHTDGLDVDPDGWGGQVTSFLASALSLD